jgi:guanosine-3',5'-bis(diphosphate) 3'-pyrophosphohydrolase
MMEKELLAVLLFASRRHSTQKRKDAAETPYVNHLIEVAELLANIGGVDDFEVLAAALLHDTVEDTGTTLDELEREFGRTVRDIVADVTDDKSLPKDERKRLQILHAPGLSRQAKLVKLGDKISNVREIGASPPKSWDLERRVAYIAWARAVVDGCRGANPALEKYFDETAAAAEKSLTS